MNVRWVFPVLVCALLAGCSGGTNQAIINFGGSGSGSDVKELACDTDGQITVSLGGQGSVTVIVTDEKGAVLYQDTSGGNGGSNDVQSLRGSAGTWRLEAAWNNVNGGLNIVLQC